MAKRKSSPAKARFIEQRIREREFTKLREKMRSGDDDAAREYAHGRGSSVGRRRIVRLPIRSFLWNIGLRSRRESFTLNSRDLFVDD